MVQRQEQGGVADAEERWQSAHLAGSEISSGVMLLSTNRSTLACRAAAGAGAPRPGQQQR